ncbi:MAG: class I SAM-dependent methyltransferase [Candidatus Omnitrophica bacterium]|nr:class I SAM-dependent methyltransferase [Candidatus Omnitrophota bacterium]
MKYNHYYWDNQANLKTYYYLCRSLALHKEKEYIKLIEQATNIRDKKCLITDLYENCFGFTKITEYLSKKSGGVIGIDISKTVLFKAKNNIRGNNIFYCASDIRNLSFHDNTFDIVISPSTLDHFPEIDIAISEIYRVLKKDGVLLLTLNNKHNLFFVFNIWFLSMAGYLPFHTESCYFRKEGRRLLKKHNFAIREETTLMHVPFLFPTIISLLERYRMNAFLKFFYDAVLLLEKMAKKIISFGLIISWWIVFVAQKTPTPNNHANKAFRNSR